MSLTSFLKNRDVKEKFSREFTMPKLGLKEEILAPPITRNYSLVGTAFDYLLRFYIKQVNPEAFTSRWIAEEAIERFRYFHAGSTEGELYESEDAKQQHRTFLDKLIDAASISEKLRQLVKTARGETFMSKDDEQLLGRFENIVSVARANYSEYLESAVMKDELIRSAISLAQLDVYFRALVIVENIGVVDEGDVTDMRNLLSIIPPGVFKAERVCILNPTFGEASNLIRGADADLIVDGTLIDIKTTKFPEFRRDYFNQIIGYYVLSRIGGITVNNAQEDDIWETIDYAPNEPDWMQHSVSTRTGKLERYRCVSGVVSIAVGKGDPPKSDIESLGVYFSRFGVLRSVPVKEVVDEATLPSFIDWFRDRAIQEGPTGLEMSKKQPERGNGAG